MFFSRDSRDSKDIIAIKERLVMLERRLDQLELENTYLRNKILRRFQLGKNINEPEKAEEPKPNDQNSILIPQDLNTFRPMF